MSSSSRFASNSRVKEANPVTFPPGRAKLATSPVPTGSVTCTMTIGTVLVARFATRAAGKPTATITSTLRPTNSAASSGSGSILPSAYRCSKAMFCPSIQPSSRSPCRNASRTGVGEEGGGGEAGDKRPILATFPACCASAASGAARTARTMRPTSRKTRKCPRQSLRPTRASKDCPRTRSRGMMTSPEGRTVTA